MSLFRHRRAFTLIELLVVIVILGILMAVAVPTFLKQQQKAQDSKTQQQLTTAYKAIRSGLSEFSNAYPAVASVVSVISQSEPELTVSSGSCNASTSDKQVVVDNVTSSANKLSLYAKSSSGTWWNLSAPAAGAPVFTKLGTCAGPLATGSMTTNGSEITDAVRTASAAGDGAAPAQSSYGLWQQTTNLATNGGFESSTSGWFAVGVGTQLTRDVSTSKFGNASLKTTTPGSIATEGPALGPINGLSASTTYTWSVWIKATAGVVVRPQIDWSQSGGTFISSTLGSTVTTSGSWQRITVTGVSPALTGQANTMVVTSSASPQAVTLWLDGAQLEQNSIATPYVDTNGSSQTRAAGLVQAPGNLLNGTQGWAAVRLHMGWPSTVAGLNGGSGFETPFNWQIDNNNRITCFWTEGAGSWSIKRVTGTGIFTQANVSGQTFAAGDPETVIFAWTPTQVMVSVNGGAFSTAANTDIPVGAAPALMEIGSRTATANQAINSNVMWFAAGTGTLSASDAASIAALGDTDPTSQDFSPAAQAALAWSADNATYVTGN